VRGERDQEMVCLVAITSLGLSPMFWPGFKVALFRIPEYEVLSNEPDEFSNHHIKVTISLVYKYSKPVQS